MKSLINLIPLVPLVPLIGFLIIGLLGKYIKKEAIIGSLASATVGISFVLSVIIFIALAANRSAAPYIVPVFPWIQAGNFDISISYQVDELSMLFSLIVTGVGFLIHIYSIGYMHKDRSFARFFAYMNLFIFMMLNLVLSSNFLLTFLGWEGVGLCSYLLIGFWYDRHFEGVRIKWTGDAGIKAFVVNRIGDFGFLLAMFMIYFVFNSLDYKTVINAAPITYMGREGLITAIALLMFLGCTGKSAQLPLAVWLPDAMAGPTPVSALIHAATMVTAGVFLVARTSVIFALSPTAMIVVAVVGTLTAIFAATIGLVQNDIKKVLAYSTVSQLGFMFAALGVGAFSAGVFHVMTHAFFKGLLFLGAGSVIHGMHEEQDIKKMGGLKEYMPATYKTFWVATLAISGIPLFSGFFSKDEILWKAFDSGGWFMWLVLVVAAFCTAFYMFRLINLVFRGNPRYDTKHIHPHESPKTMTIPLIVLAVLSAFGGFLGVPYILGFFVSHHPTIIENWLAPVFSSATNQLGVPKIHEIHFIEYVLMLISVGIALGAIYLANKYYSDPEWTIPRKLAERFRTGYKLLWNKYYLDERYYQLIIDPIFKLSEKILLNIFDIKIIDGAVNGLGRLTIKLGDIIKRIQTGFTQNYALMMLGGIIIIIVVLLLF